MFIRQQVALNCELMEHALLRRSGRMFAATKTAGNRRKRGPGKPISAIAGLLLKKFFDERTPGFGVSSKKYRSSLAAGFGCVLKLSQEDLEPFTPFTAPWIPGPGEVCRWQFA
jgi:hypothetical protein